MKKFVVSLLAAGLVLSCCACGGTESGASSVAASSVTSETTGTVDETTTETTPEETVDRSQFKIKSFNTEPTIEETVLFDSEGIKVTATGIEYTNYGAELGFKVENTTETEATVSLGANSGVVVNNFTIPAWNYHIVSPNETAEDIVSVDFEELELRGIYEIANIGFLLTVEDQDYNLLSETTVTLPTSIADTYVADDMSYQNSISDPQTADQYGYEMLNWNTDTIFDQYGVQFTSVALLKNSDNERYALVEIVNTNDTTITVALRNMDISGKNVVDGTAAYTDVCGQSRGLITIKLDRDIEDYLEDNSLVEATYFDNLQEINLEVNIRTPQDTIIKGEPLTLSFS